MGLCCTVQGRTQRPVRLRDEEVAQAFNSGLVATNMAALQLIPRLDDFVAMPTAGTQTHSALFWADNKGYVYRRGGFGGDVTLKWENKSNYDYTYCWSAAVIATT